MSNGKNILRGLTKARIFQTNRPSSVTDKFKRPSTEIRGTMQKKLGK